MYRIAVTSYMLFLMLGGLYSEVFLPQTTITSDYFPFVKGSEPPLVPLRKCDLKTKTIGDK